MSALFSWYQNQHSPWSRTHRLQMPPFLARPDTTMSRTATAIAAAAASRAEGDIVINMGELGQDPDSKNKDTLFGPSIGVVNNGPKWAQSQKSKAAPGDELTPEIVKSWVMKSKEASHPTTTLQALVNLKRPTIRLSPLASNASSTDLNNATTHHLQHGLEFEFDCDAPKCGISMHVIGVRSSEDESTATSSDISQIPMLIFETKVTGGFARKLKLEDGAMLDLMKLEEAARAGIEAEHNHPTLSHEEQDHATTVTPPGPGSSDTSPPSTMANARKKRLTFFRKRDHTTHNRAAAGPALAVVDAEGHTSANDTTPATGVDGQPEAQKNENDDSEAGVKVVIKLVALDKAGEPLRSPNVQTTYLHVVRMGDGPAHADSEEEAVEDMRPWVVKVVKREATIGGHTFHLHEIYGLSAHSHAPLPVPGEQKHEHTYPPVTPPILNNIINTAASPAAQADDDSPSECLVCLSSAREVVLLPCRHLVACRECAVNMIEFGAGGQLVHAAEEPPSATQESPATPTAATAGTEGTNNENGEPANATPTTPIAPAVPTHRRRRKAKGWFCPVCRQPYTAMLRITTSSPPMPKGTEAEVDKEKRDSMASGSSHDEPVAPAANADPLGASSAQAEDSGPGGFMRQISLMSLRGGNTTAADATLPPDLERQA